MSEAKFTPGPWFSFNNGNYWEVEATSTEYRGAICNIHDAEHIDGLTKGEQEANAHLISAAPDLYEALERLLNVSVEIAPEVQDAGVFADARAALAKARGETA